MVGEPKPEHPLHPHRPPLSRRQLLMQVVVAGVILASGIGIGTGGTILALKNRIIPRVRVMPPDPPRPEPNVIVTRWRGEYSLSDKQAQQAKDTLTKQFTAIAGTAAEVLPGRAGGTREICRSHEEDPQLRAVRQMGRRY